MNLTGGFVNVFFSMITGLQTHNILLSKAAVGTVYSNIIRVI